MFTRNLLFLECFQCSYSMEQIMTEIQENELEDDNICLIFNVKKSLPNYYLIKEGLLLFNLV